MARALNEPSATSNFQGQWTTAANIDLDSTTANTAPIIFPVGSLDNQDLVNFIFATDSTGGVTTKWQLVLATTLPPDSNSAPYVMRRINFTAAVTAGAANARRVNAVGTGGNFLLDDIMVDIRGWGSIGQSNQWYLVNLDLGVATTVQLIRYKGTTRPS